MNKLETYRTVLLTVVAGTLLSLAVVRFACSDLPESELLGKWQTTTPEHIDLVSTSYYRNYEYEFLADGTAPRRSAYGDTPESMEAYGDIYMRHWKFVDQNRINISGEGSNKGKVYKLTFATPDDGERRMYLDDREYRWVSD